jgi:hypothetical protein
MGREGGTTRGGVKVGMRIIVTPAIRGLDTLLQ